MSIPMFHKVLVAVNESDLSKRAVEQAASLVEDNFIENLTLFSVWETDEVDYTKLHSPDKEEKLKKGSLHTLERYQQLLESKGCTCKVVRAGGDPSECIIDATETGEYDLIIMGSRKLNKVQELVFGSVSDRVTRLVDIPIFVVK